MIIYWFWGCLPLIICYKALIKICNFHLFLYKTAKSYGLTAKIYLMDGKTIRCLTIGFKIVIVKSWGCSGFDAGSET